MIWCPYAAGGLPIRPAAARAPLPTVLLTTAGSQLGTECVWAPLAVGAVGSAAATSTVAGQREGEAG